MLPAILKNFNTIFDGFPMGPVAEEIALPKLSRKMDDYQGGGMLGPVELDLGIDKLSMEITFAEYNKIVLTRFGALSASGIPIRFLGAARADDDAAAFQAVEIAVRGRIKEIDKGNAKRGDRGKMKVAIPLTYLRYSANGAVLIELDLVNGIEIVNGVDLTAAIRSAIGTA